MVICAGFIARYIGFIIIQTRTQGNLLRISHCELYLENKSKKEENLSNKQQLCKKILQLLKLPRREAGQMMRDSLLLEPFQYFREFGHGGYAAAPLHAERGGRVAK